MRDPLIMEIKHVFVAYTNSDLTEGRGYDIPIAVCAIETTAIRLAKKRYVQGSDGPVRRVEMCKIDGQWWIQSSAVHVVQPSKEDTELQSKMDARKLALDKAKAAGLSDEDIQALLGGL